MGGGYFVEDVFPPVLFLSANPLYNPGNNINSSSPNNDYLGTRRQKPSSVEGGKSFNHPTSASGSDLPKRIEVVDGKLGKEKASSVKTANGQGDLAEDKRNGAPHPMGQVSSISMKRLSPESAVTIIQKHYRAYLVRRTDPLKQLRKVKIVKESLLKVQDQLADRAMCEAMKENSREHLQLSETLMRLLLELDTVQSSDTVIRNIRKDAARLAVRLQDQVDALVQPSQQLDETGPNGDVADRGSEIELDTQNGLTVNYDDVAQPELRPDVAKEDSLALPPDGELTKDTSSHSDPSSRETEPACILQPISLASNGKVEENGSVSTAEEISLPETMNAGNFKSVQISEPVPGEILQTGFQTAVASEPAFQEQAEEATVENIERCVQDEAEVENPEAKNSSELVQKKEEVAEIVGILEPVISRDVQEVTSVPIEISRSENVITGLEGQDLEGNENPGESRMYPENEDGETCTSGDRNSESNQEGKDRNSFDGASFSVDDDHISNSSDMTELSQDKKTLVLNNSRDAEPDVDNFDKNVEIERLKLMLQKESKRNRGVEAAAELLAARVRYLEKMVEFLVQSHPDTMRNSQVKGIFDVDRAVNKLTMEGPTSCTMLPGLGFSQLDNPHKHHLMTRQKASPKKEMNPQRRLTGKVRRPIGYSFM